ncbi:MAG: hypothetical protein HUJ63_13230 [Enterococcus sp.]|nr:hypothetical protein [Enterococcus sp.]
MPDSFAIDQNASLNEIASKIFSTISLKNYTIVTIPGFVKDNTAAVAVGVGISAFASADF